MNVIVIILGIVILAVLVLVLLLLGFPAGHGAFDVGYATRTQMNRIVAAQRQQGKKAQAEALREIYRSAEEARVDKVCTSELTLEKRLKYAQWKMPPLFFRLIEVVISIVACFLVSLKFNIVLTCLALLTGPFFMNWLLNLFINRRFKAFDRDYAPFLLSVVSLLKTGLDPIQALETAAQELELGSLIRSEVELMLERLRYGVPEEKSIGVFGEDIYHPEIELFVQALLLSRRVGGNLSDTLERLSKQVRKRQFFRDSANAAVGMQRGSIWVILFLMVAMEGYLYVVFPETIKDSIKDDIGWQVWQIGIVVILLGLYWIRQVTKIRT